MNCLARGPHGSLRGVRMAETDLFTAAREGTLSLLRAEELNREALLRRNASGNTPLHLAAKYGHLDQVPSDLMDVGVLRLRNDAGYTPVHLAARAGALDELQSRIVDLPTEALRLKTDHDHAPLHEAAEQLPEHFRPCPPTFLQRFLINLGLARPPRH